jgi:hypothetical protein
MADSGVDEPITQGVTSSLTKINEQVSLGIRDKSMLFGVI